MEFSEFNGVNCKEWKLKMARSLEQCSRHIAKLSKKHIKDVTLQDVLGRRLKIWQFTNFIETTQWSIDQIQSK